MAHKVTTYAEREDIVRRYNNGSTMAAIARHYLVAPNTIREVLLSRGITIRPTQQDWTDEEQAIIMANKTLSTRRLQKLLPNRSLSAIRNRIDVMRHRGFDIPTGRAKA